jgi:hypothetical protein
MHNTAISTITLLQYKYIEEVRHMSQQLPDPTTEAVKMWLKGLKPGDLDTAAWIHVNHRFHGIAMAMRTYLSEQYDDPQTRAAAFDGLVVGLLAMSHFADIAKLASLFQQTSTALPLTPER